MTDSLQFGDARSNVPEEQCEPNGHAQRIHNVISIDVFVTRPTCSETLSFLRFRGTGDDCQNPHQHLKSRKDGREVRSNSEVVGRVQIALVK